MDISLMMGNRKKPNGGTKSAVKIGFLCFLMFLIMVSATYAVLDTALWPEASGTDVKVEGGLTVDASNSSHGYVMAHGGDGGQRFKLRVTKDGFALMYDLNGQGAYETFPLQLGSGKYSFELFKNVSGSKYSQEGALSVSVDLDEENEAFLYPNQYVNYTPESRAVEISEELCEGLTTDEEKFQAIRSYVLENFTYDFNKAATIGGGVLPDIDYLLDHGMGICQDISAAVACMLRVQGIPTQIVIGYAGKQYHAWNNVWIDGQYRQVDLTLELGGIQSGVTYTVERFY